MKKIILLLTSLICGLLLISCTSKTYDIVTTMFFQYDIAKAIVKDQMAVYLLTPPGSEAHSYLPSSADYTLINEADLFIFTSLELEGSFITSEMAQMNNALDASKAFTNSELYSLDFHYWTNPYIFIEIANTVLTRIISIDPLNADFYKENLRAYSLQISIVTEFFLDFLSITENKTIYFVGHNALVSFANFFNLEIINLFSANGHGDATSTEIAKMIEVLKANNVHILFVEELVNPTIALKIKEELGSAYDLKLKELHGYHNLSKTEMDQFITYYDLLFINMYYIQIALQND